METSQLKEEFQKSIEHLKKELSSIRTGRATPTLVEDIRVESYGSIMPLNQLANISVPESTMLVIEPWDKSLVKEIEKAIQNSDLGIQPVNEGQLLRLVMPPLTEERRNDLIKILHKKLEEARVAIRGIRENAIKIVRKQEADGEISEDDLYKDQSEIQKLVDQYNEEVKQIGVKKEEEIKTI